MPHATSVCETLGDFVALHKMQLQASGIPERYWDTLFQKLKNEIFDVGKTFQMVRVEEVFDMEEEFEDDDEEGQVFNWKVIVRTKEGITTQDSHHIYLIDHAWTYQVEQARENLEKIPGLVDRMAGMMEINMEDRTQDDLIQDILRDMWIYNQTYSLGHTEMGTKAKNPVWYIMDEFGSRIQHGDPPTVRMVPFYFIPSQLVFTVFWPLKDLCEGAEVTRNYIDGDTSNALLKKVKLLPWHPEDMSHLSFEQHEADENFFLKYKVHENLPNLEMEFPSLPRDRNICVFTDINTVRDNLTDSPFEFVEDQEGADIWWTKNYLKDFRDFSEKYPDRYINQFPYEMVLTVKELLMMVGRRAKGYIDRNSLERGPVWLQSMYNLNTELAQFVSYFQHRDAAGLDNHWVCQPWSMCSGQDLHVTDNLNHLLRLPETGPKIAYKYIDDPLLFETEDFGEVRFDLRFIVMLQSIQPLKIAVHKKFEIRFANKPFSMDQLDEADRNFIMKNHASGMQVYEMICEEFVEAFEAQNPGCSWTAVEDDIYTILREAFTAASSTSPPKSMTPSPQSRAMYGADFMLKWITDDKGVKVIQPVLEEVRFCPDLSELVKYYPDYVNDVFGVLFLEDYEQREVNIL